MLFRSALVWALTELMVGDIAPGQALWELTRREAREDAERKPAEKLKPEPAKGSLEYMKALS